jgi:hypothetical protein
VATLTWMQRTAPGRYQSKDTFTYTTVSRRRK